MKKSKHREAGLKHKQVYAYLTHDFQRHFTLNTYAGQGCQLADSRLKSYWEAKLRSIDSCQNRTCADQNQKTNNVGSGSLSYTICHFLLQAGQICLTHTRSLLIRIFANLIKVN